MYLGEAKGLDIKMKRLGDAEIDIMKIIWEAEEPLTSNYIQKHLQDKRDWKLPTVMNVLSRLVTKGFVHCDRSTRTNYYSAIINKEDYMRFEEDILLSRLFGNSASKMVANLFKEKKLSKNDISAIKKMLDEFDESEG